MNRPLVLLLLALLAAACARPSPDLADPAVPESWVKPQWSPGFWYVWAEVRDFAGEKRWAALDTSWMEQRASADLAKWGPGNQNPSEHMLSGLWRLGLIREAVLAAIAELDGEPEWPLGTPGNRLRVAWRPRLERWCRAHPDEDLRAKLGAAWTAAFDAGNIENAARVVEAFDTRMGRASANALASAARQMVRREIAGHEERYQIPDGVLFLLERFGVPEGIDLKPVLTAVRARYHELEDEVIPLPSPYDLHLACLRLSRMTRGK